MAADLFGEKPRRPRRWLMHPFDGTDNPAGDRDGNTIIVRYRCGQCDTETGWVPTRNVSTAKRGIPCTQCNELASSNTKATPETM